MSDSNVFQFPATRPHLEVHGRRFKASCLDLAFLERVSESIIRGWRTNAPTESEIPLVVAKRVEDALAFHIEDLEEVVVDAHAWHVSIRAKDGSKRYLYRFKLLRTTETEG